MLNKSPQKLLEQLITTQLKYYSNDKSFDEDKAYICDFSKFLFH